MNALQRCLAESERKLTAATEEAKRLREIIKRLSEYSDHAPICRSQGKGKTCDCGYTKLMNKMESALAATQPKAAPEQQATK